MVREQYEIEVWGTVLYIAAISTTLDKSAIDSEIEDVKKFVYEVDDVFSTYKSESVISRLRRGEIEISGCSEDVIEVWNACGFAGSFEHKRGKSTIGLSVSDKLKK